MSGLRDLSDRELLVLLSRSDKRAFEEIYFRYSPLIYKTAVRFLQVETKAADLVQEVFTKLWVDREKFTEIKNLKAYFIVMSRNLALKYLRKIAKESLAREEWAISSFRPFNNSTEDHFNKVGLEKLLNETMALLPPQQRKVYYLARIEGLTYKAISHRLNISTVTVKKHMIAANRFVRERIGQREE